MLGLKKRTRETKSRNDRELKAHLERKADKQAGDAVAAGEGDLKSAIGNFLIDFESFKQKNDQRLIELEGKKRSDPAVTEPLDRLNEELSRQYDNIQKLLKTEEKSREEPAERASDNGLLERKLKDAGARFAFTPQDMLAFGCPDLAKKMRPIFTGKKSAPAAWEIDAETLRAEGSEALLHFVNENDPDAFADIERKSDRREHRGRRREYDDDRRPPLDHPEEFKHTRATREHKAALLEYMRTGNAAGYERLERKDLSVGTDPSGGHMVTPETDMMIERKQSEVSPIREIATVRSISTSAFRKPWNRGGASSGWVGETASRTKTNTPQLDMLEFPVMELYAMPAATQSLLDDAAVDMEDWLSDEVSIEFAEQEGAAFVVGDGMAQPRGFTAYATVANANWADGKIGFIKSGNANGFASANPADALIDLVYAPKQAYRQSGRFVMNRATVAEVRKIKDGEGNYLWQPGLANGQPQSLLGYPITEAEDMPDIAASKFPIAFGDFRRGYLIVDRIGVRVLRDPYTSKPFVLFYTTKRVGGGVQNFEAFKLFKIAA